MAMIRSFPSRSSPDLISPSGANLFAVWADARDVTTTSKTIYGTSIAPTGVEANPRSEEHTSELQSLTNLVCRLLLEKKKNSDTTNNQQLYLKCMQVHT